MASIVNAGWGDGLGERVGRCFVFDGEEEGVGGGSEGNVGESGSGSGGEGEGEKRRGSESEGEDEGRKGMRSGWFVFDFGIPPRRVGGGMLIFGFWGVGVMFSFASLYNTLLTSGCLRLRTLPCFRFGRELVTAMLGMVIPICFILMFLYCLPPACFLKDIVSYSMLYLGVADVEFLYRMDDRRREISRL